MSGEVFWLARSMLAATTECSETLYKLSRDPDESVRMAAAANPKLPESAMRVLICDKSETVIASLASNPSMPRNLLFMLMCRHCVEIEGRIRSDPNFLAQISEVYGKSK